MTAVMTAALSTTTSKIAPECQRDERISYFDLLREDLRGFAGAGSFGFDLGSGTDQFGWNAVPTRRWRQRFALHKQRHWTEARSAKHLGAVQNDRHVANRTTIADFEGICLHHAVFEQVRLNGASQIECGIVADLHQVEFGEQRCVQIDPA